ncbi:MAG TPA: ModD protein [Spirochaetota bacterium]|nr:ModD protein [Spirochaetota bacterium]
MVYISDREIDDFISEDIPYFDLTSSVLQISGIRGKIEFYTRNDAVLCGTEEVCRIFNRFNLVPKIFNPSGSEIEASSVFLSAEGSSENIHQAWKISLNILEYCSGIATKTKRLIDAAKKASPHIEILTTRKSFPGTKSLVTKSILSGGALPHRLGLSETILVFKEHLPFAGGIDKFTENIHLYKKRAPEKKIIAETENIEDAVKLAENGIDGIQFDKVNPANLRDYVRILKGIRNDIVLLAAGGITDENVSGFALSGVDGIVTSSLFHAKPADMGVKITSV